MDSGIRSRTKERLPSELSRSIFIVRARSTPSTAARVHGVSILRAANSGQQQRAGDGAVAQQPLAKRQPSFLRADALLFRRPWATPLRAWALRCAPRRFPRAPPMRRHGLLRWMVLRQRFPSPPRRPAFSLRLCFPRRAPREHTGLSGPVGRGGFGPVPFGTPRPGRPSPASAPGAKPQTTTSPASPGQGAPSVAPRAFRIPRRSRPRAGVDDEPGSLRLHARPLLSGDFMRARPRNRTAPKTRAAPAARVAGRRGADVCAA